MDSHAASGPWRGAVELTGGANGWNSTNAWNNANGRIGRAATRKFSRLIGGATRQLPAIAGGEPVRPSFLPYAKQWIDEADIAAVANTLRSDYLTTGPAIARFEQAIAEYVGAKYAVAFTSGTAALHGACFAAGIGAGDEVIVSPFTFAASANCVLYQGGVPVFADVAEGSFNIDPKRIEPLITERTKGLIPVDFAGEPADLAEIGELAKRNGLIVIEDAAHALGASYRGKRVGSISDMTVFSFHPVKPITTGEGGLVTTDSAEWYEKLLAFRTHGVTRDARYMKEMRGHWYYEMQELGFNYRLTDFQAALGTSQLQKLDFFLRLRRTYVDMYNEVFAGMPELVCPVVPQDRESGWHLYVLRLRLDRLTAGRDEIYKALIAENIGANVHYIPVYHHPYYQALGYAKDGCPHAETAYESCISLPLFPAMTGKDVQDVIEAVRKVIGYFKR